MAHFALGYTLYDLGRYHEAYRHLRYYAQIAPAHPWNWCWFGRAAAGIGELGEARSAYERAIELGDGEDETDATDLLGELGEIAIRVPRGSAARYFAHMVDEPRKSRIRDPCSASASRRRSSSPPPTHRTQMRKGSGVPYVGHLLGVCSLVIEEGGDEDEAIAALLHDAAEDRGGREMLDEIRRRFGEHVARSSRRAATRWSRRSRRGGAQADLLAHLDAPARVGAARLARGQAVQRPRDPARLSRRRRRALGPLQGRPRRPALVLPRAGRPLHRLLPGRMAVELATSSTSSSESRPSPGNPIWPKRGVVDVDITPARAFSSVTSPALTLR